MKILQLCIKPPFPPVDGGTMAMNGITQGLLEAGCEVRVLSVCSDKHPVLRNQMTDEYVERTHFEAVRLDLTPHPVDAFVALLCGESYHVTRFVSKKFESRLVEILCEERFDVVHLESVFLTPYVEVIRKHSDAKIVMRAHNVEHQIWQRIAKREGNPLKRWYLKRLALTLAYYEREHAGDYDGVVCITEQDGRFFGQNTRKPVEAIPFGVLCPEPIENVEAEPMSLFHIGSMDWMPNEEGVRWFLKEVWPRLHEELPGVKLYLAGRKMPADLMEMKMDGVRVVGEVEDAAYFIASKQINVVPLLSGSGIRVKIIESMSLGKPVVSTTIGAQGIRCVDGKNILVADSPEEFVAQVRRCVEDAEFCRELGENAYRLIATEYDNGVLTRRLLDFYGRLGVESEDCGQ